MRRSSKTSKMFQWKKPRRIKLNRRKKMNKKKMIHQKLLRIQSPRMRNQVKRSQKFEELCSRLITGISASSQQYGLARGFHRNVGMLVVEQQPTLKTLLQNSLKIQ